MCHKKPSFGFQYIHSYYSFLVSKKKKKLPLKKSSTEKIKLKPPANKKKNRRILRRGNVGERGKICCQLLSIINKLIFNYCLMKTTNNNSDIQKKHIRQCSIYYYEIHFSLYSSIRQSRGVRVARGKNMK